MKFAISYSCGKDSTFALHKMIKQGHTPICLMVMINESAKRSYFHGADFHMLDQYAEALNLPIIPCLADENNYALAFEEGLQKAKSMGVEAVCFGDIDIEENRKWEEERCQRVGLQAYFPLWQGGREDIVHELIRLGYQCLIKSIHKELLPQSILGKCLDETIVSIMKSSEIDICGENGEYHTLVVDGPIFTKPLAFQMGEILEMGAYAVIVIT